MSREIKFRALVDGKMITPAVWINEENLPSYSLGSAPKYPLMQYTGLKDRNGVDIYEGDIIEYWFIHIHRTNAYEMHGAEPEISWPINEIYADKRLGVVYFDCCGFFVDGLQIALISDEFSSLILDLHYCGDLDYGLRDFVVLANDTGLKSPIRKNCKPVVIGNIHQNPELLESQK